MGKSNSDLKNTVYRIAGFAKPFTWLIGLVLLLNTAFSIFTALSVAVINPLLELIFQADISPAVSKAVESDSGFLSDFKEVLYGGIKQLVYSENDTFGTLLNLSLLIIFIFLIKNIFKYWAMLSQVKLEEGVTKLIRDKVFSNMTYLSLDFYTKNKEGTLLSAITNDISVLNMATIAASTNALREILQVLIFIVLLLMISPYLTLIAFSSSIASLILLKISLKYIRRYASRMQDAMANYTSSMQETISGIRVVKAYNAEENAITRFKKQTTNYVVSAIKHRKITAMIPSINEIMAIISLSVVLFVGGSQVIVEKVITGAELMTFLFLLFSIMSPIALTIENLSKFQRGIVAAERVFRILDAKPSVEPGKKDIKGFKDNIKIENLDFAYEDLGIIKKANFEIMKTSKIAFVGASGSGKSTMLDLIIRFYDPVKGNILMDEVNIKEFDLKAYRSLFGIVGQDTMLFNDSIYNNIKYGNDEVTEEQIIKASKISNAYDFISKMPERFDTVVGDRGVTLSGGERQRVAIARALVRNPEILVFDEATSALDSESEKIVQNAINNSLENRTAILVAHRLATIINCDVIYVFESGKIVESGTHAELYEKNGIYRKLYDIQYSGAEI